MVAKNLERLFPVDTKMVVIIDDRGDVWKWSANLIRVRPFDFFVGIGDINSSFLPKKQEIQTTPKSEDEKVAEIGNEKSENGEDDSNGVAEDGTSTIQNGTSALEHFIAMSGGDDPAVRELQNKGQEELITSQLEDKPLLKMQLEQDEKDEAEATVNGEHVPSQSTESDSSDSSDSSETISPRSKARHSILKTDDEEQCMPPSMRSMTESGSPVRGAVWLLSLDNERLPCRQLRKRTEQRWTYSLCPTSRKSCRR
jgi:RNA polymerase II subunit A-like phosphatase